MVPELKKDVAELEKILITYKQGNLLYQERIKECQVQASLLENIHQKLREKETLYQSDTATLKKQVKKQKLLKWLFAIVPTALLGLSLSR